MPDYLREMDEKRAKRVAEAGLEPGDWVSLMGWFGTAWAKVTDSFTRSSVSDMFKYWRYDRQRSNLGFTSQIAKIHKKGDPWDDMEVHNAYDENGMYDVFPRREGYQPLPQELRYHGTYFLRPWLWYYCNRNATPKVARPPEPIMEAAGVCSLTGVPWDQTNEVMNRLERVRIRGWHCVFERKPEQQFKKSIVCCERL